MKQQRILRIGSRDSHLAVRQTTIVMDALQAAYPNWNLESVSYTHLDVYKRQQVCQSKKEYAVSCRKQQEEQDPIIGRRDVYKRQA